MGAWILPAGLMLFLVILNNIQVMAMEAVLNGNSSNVLQRKIFPDFHQPASQDKEIRQIENNFFECLMKRRATVGDGCISEDDTNSELNRLQPLLFKGDIPLKKLKEAFERYCQDSLECSVGGKCECTGSEDPSPCDSSMIPKKNLTLDCCKESTAYVNLVERLLKISVTDPCPGNIGNGVIDPGQNVQYLTLMTLILIVLASQ